MNLNSWKLYSFYLAVVSFVSIIAIAITLWIVLTSLWKYLLISDDEYIQNRQSWKIEDCSRNNFQTINIDSKIEKKINKKTPEEIKKCEEKAKISAIKSRSYDLKDMFISSFAWFFVFLLLFAFHYPKFLRLKK